MTLEELRHIKADRRLKVRTGIPPRDSTTTARFLRWSENKNLGTMLVIEKYNYKADSWHKPTRILPSEVVSIY